MQYTDQITYLLQIKFTDDFEKQFRRLDRSVQVMIRKWITKHLEGDSDPRDSGRPLSSNLEGYWRYRIGDYRLLAEIKDNELIIIAIAISHRSRVYRD